MTSSIDACPSCGARSSHVVNGRTCCRFCGTEFVPRLVPGALCLEPSSPPCRVLADCLCTACGRALCSRHGSPRTLYWNESLHWRRLVPTWTDADAIAWARILSPLPPLPVPDFEPFAWQDYAAANERELGELEAAAAAAVRAEAARFGGSLREDGVLLDAICSTCEATLREAVRKVVEPLAPEFRRTQYEQRLDAREADLRQALVYVETFLRRAVPMGETEDPDGIPFGELTVESHADEWLRLGQELRRRLEIARRLALSLVD
jgi:hypothetical protein